MARTLATLPEGSRITDYISLGVITRTFPLKRVRAVLAATGKASQRGRDLPAHVMVYYAIALALYMQSSYREVLRCLLEGVQWLLDPAVPLKATVVPACGARGAAQTCYLQRHSPLGCGKPFMTACSTRSSRTGLPCAAAAAIRAASSAR